MKYYLRETQDVLNDDYGTPEFVEYAKEIKRKQSELHNDYLAQLAMLRSRLTEKTYKLLSTYSDPLFDSNLMAISIGDSVRKNIKYGSVWFHTEAMIRLITFDEDAIYTLKYRAVQSAKFDLPHARWYESSQRREIGCLLSHEVVAIDELFLSHEFLFTSGATINIEFQKLDVVKQRLKKGSFKSRHLSENLL